MMEPAMPAELAEIIQTHRALFGGFTMMADDGGADGQPQEQDSSADGGADGQPQEQDSSADDGTDAPPQKEEPDWKARSRQWEKQAKANKAAAEELAALKQQQQTAEERAAERERQAEERAAQAEFKALRREIALGFELSKDDAELLDDLNDEEAIRRMATRLAATNSKKDDEPPADRGVRRQKPREGAPEGEAAQARKVARKLFSGK